MCKTLLPLKLLIDADAWKFWGKTKLIFYIFTFNIKLIKMKPEERKKL